MTPGEELEKDVKKARSLKDDTCPWSKAGPHLTQALRWADETVERSPTPGEVKLEVVGAFLKVTVTVHEAWLKKSFFLSDPVDLWASIDAGMINDAIPWEEYRSYKVRKDPRRPKRPKG